jgi:hypothetical protein
VTRFFALAVAFGGAALAIPALLAETTAEVIENAMKHSHTKDILAWCKEHLGTTL